METISIPTSQNITIDQPIASVAERIVATIIDFAIFAAYFWLGMLIFSPHGLAGFTLLGLPLMLYSLVCELMLNGQSIGKMVMNIKVVKVNGVQPVFVDYFIRWIFRLIDIFVFFGGIAMTTIIINRKGQRFGDIAANTTVIRMKEKRFNDTLYMHIPENYAITFPEVTHLNENDMYTIKEVLDFLKEAGRNRISLELAAKTKNAIAKKMETIVTMGDEKFLFTVLRDYNFLNSK